MKKSLLAALLSLTAFGHSYVAETDFETRAPAQDFHLWISPMIGAAGPGPAMGFGVNASSRHLMGSVRYIVADEFCIMCEDSEEMQQSLYLFGVKNEGPLGYVALLSGLSHESASKKENFVREGGMFTDAEYDMVTYRGFGVPIVVELGLTARYIGIGASLVANINQHNSDAGFMLNLPLGNIRR